MALVDGASCNCLPDCKTTDYQYSMTSSKLRSKSNNLNLWKTDEKPSWRSCDSRNLNLSPLCTLEDGPIPKLWLDQARMSLGFCFQMFESRWRNFISRRGKKPTCPTTLRTSPIPTERSTLTQSSNCDPRYLFFPFLVADCLNIKHNIRIGFGNVKPIKDIYLVFCSKKSQYNLVFF